MTKAKHITLHAIESYVNIWNIQIYLILRSGSEDWCDSFLDKSMLWIIHIFIDSNSMSCTPFRVSWHEPVGVKAMLWGPLSYMVQSLTPKCEPHSCTRNHYFLKKYCTVIIMFGPFNRIINMAVWYESKEDLNNEMGETF